MSYKRKARVNVSSEDMEILLGKYGGCLQTVSFLQKKMKWEMVTDSYIHLTINRDYNGKEIILNAKYFCWNYQKGLAAIVFSRKDDFSNAEQSSDDLSPYMIILRDPKKEQCSAEDLLNNTYSFVDGLTDDVKGVAEIIKDLR